MASPDPRCLSRRQQGLPPLTLEERLNLGEPGPSTEEKSPLTNLDYHIDPYQPELPEDPFTEGIVPNYNPPLTDPLGPVIIQIPPRQDMSAATPTSISPPVSTGSIPMATIPGSPSSSPPVVSSMPLLGNPSSQHMPTPNPMVNTTVSSLPNPSASTPTLTTLGPTVAPPASMTTSVPFSNPFG